MKKCLRFLEYVGVKTVLAVLVLIFAGIYINDASLIDWTIFSSIVIVVVLNGIADIFERWIKNEVEDSEKLATNYKRLVSEYIEKVVVYDNSYASEINREKMTRAYKNVPMEVRIPVVCEYMLENKDLDIQDSGKMYELPEIIREHLDELFSAHSTSNIYNQLTIRVDGWGIINNTFVLQTSRTTFFNSLVTNRAMDFRWKNGMTVRYLFEYGPFLHSLKESRLSNHLGFNGFVESSDGYIVFVKRDKNLSIGKSTYGDSIGASLKTKYALNEYGVFTVSGLNKGIKKEICNELKISESGIGDIKIIAAYRDLVEGGKPQLLFYTRSNWEKDEIERTFHSYLKKFKRKEKEKILVDGKKLLWISRQELKRIVILPDAIIHNGKIYPMMPSASAAVVMLLDYLK